MNNGFGYAGMSSTCTWLTRRSVRKPCVAETKCLDRNVAFHYAFDPAFAREADGHCNSLTRVCGRHNLIPVEIDVTCFGDFPDRTLDSDEDRDENTSFGRRPRSSK
jgi:hypothetical protein